MLITYNIHSIANLKKKKVAGHLISFVVIVELYIWNGLGISSGLEITDGLYSLIDNDCAWFHLNQCNEKTSCTLLNQSGCDRREKKAMLTNTVLQGSL